MSLSSEKMMLLMAYADGQLEDAERTEAEGLLASDTDAVRFVEQVAELGELLQLGHEGRSSQRIASFDVADAVVSLAARDRDAAAQEATRSRIPSLDDARAKKTVAGAGASPMHRVGAGVGIACALALAASIFLFVQNRDEETPMASGPSHAASVVASGAAVANDDGPGVDVSTVESAGNSVRVFYLPTANELSTSVVVWVDETGEKK